MCDPVYLTSAINSPCRVMSVNGVTDGLVRLTLNFLEHIVVSLDHLKSKFSRAQFLLNPKEKVLI